MAITSALCSSFKSEILTGLHNFTASTGDVFKIALYTSSATLGASTTLYSTTNEVTGTGYTAGGATLTQVSPALSGTTAVITFSNPSWANASFTANGAVIYNSSTKGGTAGRAVAVYAFGSDQTVSSGTFTITMPTADAANAVIRIA